MVAQLRLYQSNGALNQISALNQIGALELLPRDIALYVYYHLPRLNRNEKDSAYPIYFDMNFRHQIATE